MAVLDFLKWDSEFFGFKTAAFHLGQNVSTLTAVQKEAKKRNIRLLYLYSNCLLENEDILNRCDGTLQLVDRKLTYEKDTNGILEDITENIGTGLVEDLQQLLPLAYEAGKYSRFKVDSGIPEVKFRELYHLWLSRSLAGKIADRVLTYFDSEIKGFVTLKKNESSVSIGLIAVNQNWQGRGIGKSLLTGAQQFARQNQKSKMEVVTQEDNQQACNFYEKFDFELKKREFVYHWWL